MPPMVSIISDLDQFLEPRLKASRVIIGETAEDDERYIPLPLRQLAGDQELPFDLFLKVKSPGQEKPHFVRCCGKGQVFQRHWLGKLEHMQLTWVYFHPTDEAAVLQYLEAHLDKSLSGEHLSPKEKAQRLYDVTLIWLRHFFTQEQQRTGPRLQLALRCLDELCGLINAEQTQNSFVMDLWQHDKNLYAHSLNTCLIGLAFVNYLGWRRTDARDFGLGALLHDIGMVKVPHHILTKPDKISAADRELIRKHPVAGFHILKNYAVLRYEVLLMVVQHHENCDGSGYPEGLTGHKIHPWARILRILDSYEALTTVRAWRAAYPPKEALWVMRDEWDKSHCYDHSYLQLFIKFLAA